MAHFQRFGYGLGATVVLGIGGIIYAEVFAAELMPLVTGEHSGQFTQYAQWLDRLAPLIIVLLLLAVWLWVIGGAIQEERTVERRRRL